MNNTDRIINNLNVKLNSILSELDNEEILNQSISYFHKKEEDIHKLTENLKNQTKSVSY